MKICENSTLMIAELSANHGRDIKIAIETIHAAKHAGADAIKLQTFTPDTITIDCRNKYFTGLLNDTLWNGSNFYDLYKSSYLPWEWHAELFSTAEDIGLHCFSSPFDRTAVDFLEQFTPPAYKIASFEIQDIPLIEYAASKGRPMIISTGIAELQDIELAVNACRNAGNDDITLMKCTSSYPAPIEEANLITIPDMHQIFGLPVGLSDHTMGSSSVLAAVALGATVIEKHFILYRKLGGPDAQFSIEPDEFSLMVKSVREVEKALGRVTYELTEKAKKSKIYGRSLFIVEDVKAGDIINSENVRSIRPGYGMHPKYFSQIIGRKFISNQKRGTPLSWEVIL